ncbi:N-6 DNA methylase [Promicromonospora sp. AC04]|uniref:N-6 DNA methylase n=1 Tax=Promicromonospora sp. AC04 TaxID=2135723 RepID=UPI000D3C6531|nr:N-6 DNA methylase [Promicromonospora sp. AC04]PUB32493.1 N-6 DNA methylase [Promicromonospora sp. AC04]
MTTLKKLLEANTGSGRRRVTQVFQDFCELGALAIRNVVQRRGFDEREDRYLSIAATYTPEEMDRFATALAYLTLELQARLSDVLGTLYMSLDLGNQRLGQFFTPYEVSVLAARITAGDLVQRLQTQEFVTVGEPTCGSGGMVIATAEALRDAGVNYQTSMHVTAQDIDSTAVHMTYIQLALLHVPAIVVHGNTLTMERRDIWPTPAHVLGGWHAKLRPRGADGLTSSEPPTANHPAGHVVSGADAPSQTGGTGAADKTLILCECCALKLDKDDDSACRGLHHHTHPGLDAPTNAVISHGPLTWDGAHDLACQGHQGGIVRPSETYWLTSAISTQVDPLTKSVVGP